MAELRLIGISTWASRHPLTSSILTTLGLIILVAVGILAVILLLSVASEISDEIGGA